MQNDVTIDSKVDCFPINDLPKHDSLITHTRSSSGTSLWAPLGGKECANRLPLALEQSQLDEYWQAMQDDLTYHGVGLFECEGSHDDDEQFPIISQ